MKFDTFKVVEKEQAAKGVKSSSSFGLADNAKEMIFNMFTKNIYSNPVGSVVREITSNCFDSHVEAKVTSPVVIRHSKENDKNYINFIDVGVGMSPDRVANVYSQYFTSTKRNDNNQIGGFGLGSKTVFAYTDAFHVITVYDGIKYIYHMYKTDESPKYDLMYEDFTEEHNGTTIKVPLINPNDVYLFESEISRQLYYFENIVFEGFSTSVNNYYKIYHGTHFLFRGTNYQNRIHICLGKVAYPLDYDAVGIRESDHVLPIALKFNIGDLNITASRENLDYNEKTKTVIKEKIKLALDELKDMLNLQCKNIGSLNEYYNTQSNYGILHIDKKKDISLNIRPFVNNRELIYPALSNINIPNHESLMEYLVDIKMMGVKKKRNSTPDWSKSILDLKGTQKVYLLKKGVKKNNRTQSWLKMQHDYYYLLTVKEDYYDDALVNKYLSGSMDAEVEALLLKDYRNFFKSDTTPTSKHFKEIKLLLKEAMEMIKLDAKHYDKIEIPTDFVVKRNSNKGELMLDREISLKYYNNYSYFYGGKIKVKDLLEYKGTIIYSIKAERHELLKHMRLLNSLDMRKENKDVFDIFDNHAPIQGIVVAKNLLPIITRLRNVIPHTEVYSRFVLKKRDKILDLLKVNKFIEMYDNLNTTLLNKGFLKIDPLLKTHVKVLTTKYRNSKKIKEKTQYNLDSFDIELLKIDVDKISIDLENSFKYIEKQDKKNNLLKYINIPEYEEITSNHELMELLQKVYVK